MKLGEIINTIKQNRVPNITNRLQMSEERIVSFINEGILSLYNQFTIEVEQAIILVPKNRNIFHINKNDPNIIMGSINKIAKAKTFIDIYKLGLDKNNLLKELELDNDIYRLLKDETILEPIEIDSSIDELIKTNEEKEILQILNVEDDKGNEYEFNIKNVFIIDQNTLYFPECEERSKIYVTYKVRPKQYTLDDINEKVCLPETLLDCLYSFIDLRAVSSIEGFKEFYPNLLNSYNMQLEKALMNSYVLPTELVTKLEFKKGFY